MMSGEHAGLGGGGDHLGGGKSFQIERAGKGGVLQYQAVFLRQSVLVELVS